MPFVGTSTPGVAVDRTLAFEVHAVSSSARTLEVAADGSWFRIDATPRVDIARRRVLRALIVGLADAHRRAPGQSLPAQALIERAWPGDRTPLPSARNRLYFAMNALRALGLRSIVLRARGGYALASDVEVRIETH